MKLIIEYLEHYNLKEWGEMSYAHRGDACMDLRAAISEPVTLKPGEFKIISNGFKAEIIHENDMVEIQVRGRSGLSAKHGINLANGIGVIDFDYRGEFRTILINNSNVDYTIHPGDRISQMAIVPIFRPAVETGKVTDTDTRGTGGFGSTGKK